MLYVGFLEAPYQAKIRSAYVIGFGALLFILISTRPLFLRMARDIFSPLERMTHTMEQVQKGDLDARIGPMGACLRSGRGSNRPGATFSINCFARHAKPTRRFGTIAVATIQHRHYVALLNQLKRLNRLDAGMLAIA